MSERRTIAKSVIKVPEVVWKEEAVNQKLVDEAEAFIKNKLAETVIRGMVEIGSYVFERFFEGDEEKVTSRDPTKDTSFAELAARCDTAEMPISKTWLHTALWVAVAAERLSANSAFLQLPPSHQTVLLRLRQKGDFEKMEKAAGKVLDKQFTVEQVRKFVASEVAKLPKDASRGGRPLKKLILKTLDRSLKVFAFEEGKRSFAKADVDALDDEEVKSALKTAQKLKVSLENLIERLEKKKA